MNDLMKQIEEMYFQLGSCGLLAVEDMALDIETHQSHFS